MEPKRILMSQTKLPDSVNREPVKQTYPSSASQETFLRRALIVIGLTVLSVILLWVLWQGLTVFLLIFGGILLGVFLRACADGLKRVTHLPDKLSVSIVIILLLGIVAGVLWWIGPQVAEQFGQLDQSLISASEQIYQILGQSEWGEQALTWLPPPDDLFNQAGRSLQDVGIISDITGIVSRGLEVLGGVVIVFFSGVFFAFNPGLYMRGLVRLFPQGRRARVWEILRAEEHTLRWWLIGTLISMTIAGLLSGLALWFLDVPLAFTLAILAGLLEFVPYIGPLLATIPAVLLGFTVSPQTALWVLILYTLIQILEGDLILPLIMKKTVKLPPVVTITAQVLLGILAGALGVLFATPIAATTLVLVQMVYIEDTLGDSMDVKKTEN